MLLTRLLNKRGMGESRALLLNEGCSLQKAVYVNYIARNVGGKEH